MSRTEGSHKISFAAWRQTLLPVLRQLEFPVGKFSELTLLAYFFWDDERIETLFPEIEFSFLCAFRCIGLTRSVLVTNRVTSSMRNFCSKYGIEIQLSSELVGGIPAMCDDCALKLYRRFDTPYVLIIQTDGIMVRSGIDKWLRDIRVDYVGAPWVTTVSRKWFPYPKYGVGNGGFSLRSRRICRCASWAYRLSVKHLPFGWYRVEDAFYCALLRKFSWLFFHRFRFPSLAEAAHFAIENDTCFRAPSPPLGFHGRVGFEQYVKAYGVPTLDLPDLVLEA